MADPTGAAAAIASLNGCIAGAHSLQITYAIVQRNATTAAPSEPTLPNASIIVQGLSPSVLRTEDDVRSAFSAFGPIIDVSLHVSADAPVAGACAQITYGNAHSASSAVQACHGVGHGGFVMQVRSRGVALADSAGLPRRGRLPASSPNHHAALSARARLWRWRQPQPQPDELITAARAASAPARLLRLAAASVADALARVELVWPQRWQSCAGSDEMSPADSIRSRTTCSPISTPSR